MPLKSIDIEQVQAFHRDGYLRVPQMLDDDEVQRHLALYKRFLDGTIRTDHLRADLAGESQQPFEAGRTESITQIMWPSSLVPPLVDGPLHRRALEIAKQIYGEDMAFDFDMLINKAPHTNTPTPWHQDAAYWVSLPDRRALSFWIALEKATIENGCMWFVPGSHLKELRPHHQTGGTGALECDGNESEGVPIPLSPGDATIHHGATLHYSRGNSTDQNRPAFILNFRPAQMILLEREKGMDHGLKAETRDIQNRSAVTS